MHSMCSFAGLVEKQKFLAVAKDFTDDKALERRLSVREEHLAKARQSKIEKRIAMGGALLDSHEVKPEKACW